MLVDLLVVTTGGELRERQINEEGRPSRISKKERVLSWRVGAALVHSRDRVGCEQNTTLAYQIIRRTLIQRIKVTMTPWRVLRWF
ncbi:MAG: hypothetical protein CM1200mP41_38480 [Gammaproteobacteria bacterium]|nr:MAG: hypothetical protein CM1200mP41_38480 [Gammaproteobacteria bacterium]